ncbi:MAG: hypothetical protein ACRCT2_16445 [Plesiomonas shigelloides]
MIEYVPGDDDDEESYVGKIDRLIEECNHDRARFEALEADMGRESSPLSWWKGGAAPSVVDDHEYHEFGRSVEDHEFGLSVDDHEFGSLLGNDSDLSMVLDPDVLAAEEVLRRNQNNDDSFSSLFSSDSGSL